ncbi:MAG: arylesterase [Acidobacteria bacterium]|nr:arylesterase [Acidobacteriota bacterium]
MNRLSSIFCAFLIVALLSACSSERPLPRQQPAEPAPETPESPQPSAMTVLCLGDSLTEGSGLDRSQAYPARLQEKVDALDWKFTVINAGLGGDTTAAGLRRLDWLLQRRVDVLIVALGGNDGLRGLPLAEIRRNLGAIISKTTARYPEVKVVVAGIRIPPNYGTRYVRGFGHLFPEVASEHGALLVPFLLEGVGGRPELNFPDGIHPNGRGQQIVAENVWKIIEPLLRELHHKAEN